MKCEFCGQEIPDNAAFCPECGAPQKKPAAETVQKAESAVNEAEKAAETAVNNAAGTVQIAAEGAKETAEAAAASVSEVSGASVAGAQNVYDQTHRQAQEILGQAPSAQAQPQQGYQPQQPAYQQPQQGYQPQQPVYQQPQQPAAPATGKVKKAKKSKDGKKKSPVGKIILVILLLIVIGAGVFVALNWEQVKNWAIKTFSDDQKYLNYSVTNTLKKSPSQLDDLYAKVREVSQKEEAGAELGLDTSLSLKLGSGADQLLAGFGADLDWLKSLEISSADDLKGQSAGGGFKLNLNSKEIFDGAYYFDMESGDVVISVPKLASQAFRVNVFETDSDSEYGYGESGRTVIQSVIPALSSAKPYVPDQELLERIRDRYKDLIIENLEDLSRADEELSAGGISEKYTVITVKLTEKTVKKVVKAVLKELKGDKDVKEFLKGSYDSLAGIVKSVPDASADFPADFDEFYEKFRDSIDDRLGEVDEGDLDMGSKTPAVRICVDSEGVVKGLTFKADDVDVSLLIAEKGDDHALEFKENDLIGATLKWSDGSKKAFDLKIVNNGDEILRAKFDGKDSNGAVTGEGSLEIAGKDILGFSTEELSVTEKAIKGKAALTPGKDFFVLFKDALGDSVPEGLLSSVSLKVALELDLDVTEDGGKVNAALKSGDSELIAVTSDMNKRNAKSPEKLTGVDITDPDNAQALMEEMQKSAPALLDGLKAAGVPEELLEDAADSISGDIPVIPTSKDEDDVEAYINSVCGQWYSVYSDGYETLIVDYDGWAELETFQNGEKLYHFNMQYEDGYFCHEGTPMMTLTLNDDGTLTVTVLNGETVTATAIFQSGEYDDPA